MGIRNAKLAGIGSRESPVESPSKSGSKRRSSTTWPCSPMSWAEKVPSLVKGLGDRGRTSSHDGQSRPSFVGSMIPLMKPSLVGSGGGGSRPYGSKRMGRSIHQSKWQESKKNSVAGDQRFQK